MSTTSPATTGQRIHWAQANHRGKAHVLVPGQRAFACGTPTGYGNLIQLSEYAVTVTAKCRRCQTRAA